MGRAAAAWVLGLGLLGCTGEEFAASGGTGGGDGTSSSSASGATSGGTSTGSTASTGTGAGGGCPGGCIGDGVCREGTSEQYCGQDGGACDTCEPPADDCQRAVCEGTCATAPRQDGAPCDAGAGQCQGGTCVDTGENCTDGIDNEDEDTDVDCLDADCSAYACSDPAPAGGWAGPFLVFASDAAIACPAGTNDQGALRAAPQGTCTCSEPELESCSVTFDVDAACPQVTPDEDVTLAGTDTAKEGCSAELSAAAISVEGTTTVGTCSSAGTLTNGTSTVLSTCEILGAGCDAREVCAPPVDPPGGAEVLLCIRGPGSETTCPASFSDRRPAWLDPGEATCSCTCEVTPDTCGGTLHVSNDAACAECGTCGTLALPAGPECTGIAAGAGAVHAWFELDPDLGTLDEGPGPITFPGEPTALYCCQPYPLP